METASALVELAQYLRNQGYEFVTITPASHGRVLRRNERSAEDLRDVFGWNRDFRPEGVPADCMRLMERAQVVRPAPDRPFHFRSAVRFSTLSGNIFVHSAFPTSEENSVFFGPDTYRFARLIEATLAGRTGAARFERGIDLGCGSGAGGILGLRSGNEMVLSDINDLALTYAYVNARLNPSAHPTRISYVKSDFFANVAGDFDLILANPPFIVDERERAYRHGGGRLGTELTERIVAESLERLRPGGKLVLYGASPIENGRDALREYVREKAQGSYSVQYSEIDPDIFGEMLTNEAYASVDRLAAIGIVLERAP